MSKKQELYLPLSWANKIDTYWKDINADPETARVIVEHHYPFIEKLAAINSNPVFSLIYNSPNTPEMAEARSDINAFSLVKVWERNKQVYKFDSDFINELLDTESIYMTKNLWDYLPYDTLYVDISDCPDVCKSIIGDGFFLKIEKVNNQEKPHYCIYAVKVTNDIFFTDIFVIDNIDKETKVDDIPAPDKVKIARSNDELYKDGNAASFDGRLYKILIFQILSYLSSSEPDVEENENTKRTYRKPAPGSVPKNKFSEIQQWDIGVRFGTAFRKWKKQQAATSKSSGESGTRAKQRPHSRRAHWSYYWYGSGENKERRPKWISSYFVNTDGGEETNPATIHSVNNNKGTEGDT